MRARLLPLLFMLTLASSPAAGNLCLPHLFENGLRLHDWNGPSLFDISLILRQHEICSRPGLRPEEAAISLFGNSSVFGLHVPAEQTFAGLMNQHWDSRSAPLHIYNLGFVFPYQFKDALILRSSLDYKPDLIVYGITLNDFIHLAPLVWPDTLTQFFNANDSVIDRLDDGGAEGLDELVDIFRERPEYQNKLRRQWTRLRELGSYLRLAARHNAPALINRWLLAPGDGAVPVPPRKVGKAHKAPLARGTDYDCEKVVKDFKAFFGDNDKWSSWSALDYLAQVQRETGVDVVVFDVPIKHDPSGDCYNWRYPARGHAEYRRWMREQTKSLGLEFWDLHDLLSKAEFEDSIHPTESGHRRLANELIRRIESHLKTRPIGRGGQPAGNRALRR